MAQTWPISRRKKAALSVIDSLGRAAFPLLHWIWTPRPDDGAEPSRILVVEPWLIGDVVLVTPLLLALRERFPEARISLLAKAHGEELLRDSGLVDQFIIFDFPWTVNRGKYKPSRYDRQAIRSLIRGLREEQFDLTIDCRMDIRSNVVTFASGAPRRIGWDFGGGSYLLTDALAASPDAHHKVYDWLALLEPLDDGRWGGSRTAENLSHKFKPRLNVTAAERAEATRRMQSLGILDDDLVVAIHPGASRPRGRWPLENFAWVADSLTSRHSTKSLVFLDPMNYGQSMPLTDARFMRTSLRELMAALTRCDLLLCNDSGPMHIADALGVPVVGVFTTGNPVWHRPFGDDQATVGHGTGQEFVSYPAREDVLKAAEVQLARATESRKSGALTSAHGTPRA